jgi:hypothetical protein
MARLDYQFDLLCGTEIGAIACDICGRNDVKGDARPAAEALLRRDIQSLQPFIVAYVSPTRATGVYERQHRYLRGRRADKLAGLLQGRHTGRFLVSYDQDVIVHRQWPEVILELV